jgi:pilus assembly protein CpaE
MPIIDARYYKTLLISPNRSVTAEITPLLGCGLPLAPIHDVNAYPVRRQLVDLLRTADPKLCFLDFSTEQQAYQVLRDLHSLAPQLPVVALIAANNPDLVLQCLRQGATDFLIRPFTTDQLDACIQKVSRLVPVPSKNIGQGKIIAVMPAKGASGATTIACNLAFQCRRLGATKVLLADLDPLTGTVSFVLKIKSTYCFVDVIQRKDSLEADLWKQMTTTSQGVDVLLAPETLVDPQSELSAAGPIIEFAQGMYDAVVLDCGGVYGDWNLSIARAADEVLLVSSNDLPALHAAQRALMYLDSQRIDIKKVKLIVSRYQKDAGLRREHLAEAIDSEVFEFVPADNDAVRKSLMDGKPIQSASPMGKSLAAIASRLVELREKDTKKPNGKGLLSSLFR